MFNMHDAILPRDITTLLNLRGMPLPPLQWQEGANRAAKLTLDGEDLAKLFGSSALADESYALAVQGLLYLWNGWPDECVDAASSAPAREYNYLRAICYRQAGRPSEAKEAFQAVDRHDIYESLVTFAMDRSDSMRDASVERYRQLIEMATEWEPYAFIDLFEQARAGSLSEPGVRRVRELQGKEFELLFTHCFEAAAGREITRRADDSEARQRLRQRRRREETGRRRPSSSPAASAKPAASVAVADAPPAAVKIKVACPKCGQDLQVPEDQRGKRTQCGKCRAAFLVPQRKQAGVPAAGSQVPSIGVRCPKCSTTKIVPKTERGRRTGCTSCGAAFLVPG